MDRRLRPHRRRLQRRQYGRTKPGTLLKQHIPLRTDRWDVGEPGFAEIDLVAHSGERAAGDFVYTLNLTDIHTTWVESGALLGKSQVRVRTTLDQLRAQLPFRLQGIDSDNGSEFINFHLHAFCQAEQIQFTRGRPYKKDDNAHIEQKNWTHVRKLMGYLRYDTPTAVAAMNARVRRLAVAPEPVPPVRQTRPERTRRGTRPTRGRGAAHAAGTAAYLSRRRSRPVAPVAGAGAHPRPVPHCAAGGRGPRSRVPARHVPARHPQAGGESAGHTPAGRLPAKINTDFPGNSSYGATIPRSVTVTYGSTGSI